MTLWAYIIASVSLLCGITAMFAYKRWKAGAWISCLAIAVFAGSSLNIGTLFSVGDAFKYSQVNQQLTSLSNAVNNLRVDMVQSVVFTQQISQTVNMVTEVKREVADIRVLISELYSRVYTEKFHPDDEDRIAIVQKEDGANLVVLKTAYAPIPNSVIAVSQHPSRGQSPILTTPMPPFNNLLLVTWASGPKADIEDYIYNLSYTRDIEQTNLCKSIRVVESNLVVDNITIIMSDKK